MTTLTVRVDRDSVAAGDDVDPHHAVLSISPTPDLSTVLARVRARYPLPSISGGQATWIISCPSGSGTPFPYDAVAVAAQQWASPKLLVSTGTDAHLAADGSLTLYFRYIAQTAPDAVIDALTLLAKGA